MNCTAESLSLASACLYNCLSEKQLLAALVYIQCVNNGGGGGGGGSVQVLGYTANPNTEAVTPANVNLEAVAVSPGKPIYTWTIPAGPWV